MWHRLLFAIDQYESGQTALRFTSEIAGGINAEVSVIHIREISKWARVPPLETPAEAESLVQEAILNLQLAGVRADGIACSVPEDLVASRIFGEARSRLCDAIIVGSRRLHGMNRLSGRNIRDRNSPTDLPARARGSHPLAERDPQTAAVRADIGLGRARRARRGLTTTSRREGPPRGRRTRHRVGFHSEGE